MKLKNRLKLCFETASIYYKLVGTTNFWVYSEFILINFSPLVIEIPQRLGAVVS
jgi:hypothetical protein